MSTMTDTPSAEAAAPRGDLALVNFLIALAALCGSLYLTLGMGLVACPLCLYQRTFVMAVVAVLGVGVLAKVRPAGTLALLALPVCMGGVAVGALHVYLEYVGKLECPRGVAEVGSAPQQALAIQAVLLLLLLIDAVRGRGLAGALGAVLLGLAFGVAAIRTAPPPPEVKAPYPEGPIKGCRPPYRPPAEL